MNSRSKPAANNSAHKAAHANIANQKPTSTTSAPAKGPKAAKGEDGQRVETGETAKTTRKRREPGLAPSRSSSRLEAKNKGDTGDLADASVSGNATVAHVNSGETIVDDTSGTGRQTLDVATFTISGHMPARASSLPLIFGDAPPITLSPFAENGSPARGVSYLGGRRSIPGGFDDLDDSPAQQQRRRCFSFLDTPNLDETVLGEHTPATDPPQTQTVVDSPRLRETAEGLRRHREEFRASMASIAETQAEQKRALEAKDQELATLRAELDRVNATPAQEAVEQRASGSASPTGTNTTDDLINSLRDKETLLDQGNATISPSTNGTDNQNSSQDAATTDAHDTNPPRDPPPRRTTGTYALSGTELRDITAASAAVPRPRADVTQAHAVPPPMHPALPTANPYDLALTAPDILRPCEVTRFPSGWSWKVEGWSATEIKENISAFTASVWNKKEGPKAIAILMGNNPNVYQPLIRADGTLIEEKQAMDSIRRVFRQETGITVDVFSASTANTPENYIPMFLVTNLTEDAIAFYDRLPIGVKTIVSFFVVPWNPPPSPYIFAFDNLHKLENTLENCRLVKEAVIRRWIELPNVRTFLTTKSDTSVPHDTEGLTEFLRQRMEVRAYDLEGKPVFNVYCRSPTVENYSKWMGIV
ncbi:hypothetical protein PQX77_017374 [Marasmius sp. AFHP31]|nr:hypothetical protein PQX77_017374 [Marasmius sp. AFHP31]